MIYVKGKVRKAPGEEVRLYQVSQDGNTLVRIQEIPVFHSRALIDPFVSKTENSLLIYKINHLLSSYKKALPAQTQFFKQLAEGDPRVTEELLRNGLRGALAVCRQYVLYGIQL